MWKSGVSGEFRYFACASRRERPPAEGDDAAAEIGDREHDAVAEAVVGDGDVLAGDQQPRLDHLLLRDAGVGQMLLQRVAARRRIADAEALLGLRRKAALAQIGARLAALRRPAAPPRRSCAAFSITSCRLARSASRRLRIRRRARAAGCRPRRRAARRRRESSAPPARPGSGNGRRRRRSRSSGSGPCGPRHGRTASSRHGTGSRPRNRRGPGLDFRLSQVTSPPDHLRDRDAGADVVEEGGREAHLNEAFTT